MNVTKKCELCETPLELEQDGRRLAFKAHDDAFCRGATLMRLRSMQRALDQAAQDRAMMEMSIARHVFRHDIETLAWRDSLTQALEQWNDDGPESRRLERLLIDPAYFDEAVTAWMRSIEAKREVRE